MSKADGSQTNKFLSVSSFFRDLWGKQVLKTSAKEGDVNTPRACEPSIQEILPVGARNCVQRERNLDGDNEDVMALSIDGKKYIAGGYENPTVPKMITIREQEILELIWAGFKNKEIGEQLKISSKTVETHRASMMKKLCVSNASQLLKSALEAGLIKVR